MQYRIYQDRVNAQQVATLRHLKTGIWLYFLLIIFEGALRKWFLPFLATPLLIVRDPIALWVIITAFNKSILKLNFYVIAIFLISFLSFFAAILLGHGNVYVALFGLRIFVIHFPFMFAVGKIFTPEDVIKFGKAYLWMSLPIAILLGLQFYSPQSAWVNRGVGGDESGAGFSGANGFFRPPGTFSFTNGNALFFSADAMFLFYFFIQSKKISRFLLFAASAALMAAIPLSISRTLIFSATFCALFMLFALSRKPQYFGKIFFSLIGVFVLFILASKLSFFQTALDATTTRFTTANESEGGLVQGVIADRYLGGMVGAVILSSQQPFFGYGLGMGTNVGAQILTGKMDFLIAEGEWGRLIGEMGLFLGLLIILIRVSFSLQLAILSFKRMRYDDFLPWMMVSFAILSVPQGQWAQPTSLGFSTMAGGLVLASLNRQSK